MTRAVQIIHDNGEERMVELPLYQTLLDKISELEQSKAKAAIEGQKVIAYLGERLTWTESRCFWLAIGVIVAGLVGFLGGMLLQFLVARSSS